MKRAKKVPHMESTGRSGAAGMDKAVLDIQEIVHERAVGGGASGNMMSECMYVYSL